MSSNAIPQNLIGLTKRPIAIAFFEEPPDGLERWDKGEAPAGCFFWQQAWDGHSFYTVPADHYNCAVGCHTHSIPLPSERAQELDETIGLMIEHNYVSEEEIPGIPTLKSSPGVICYGPVDSVPFEPDVVIAAVNPAQGMLIYEAVLKAGAGNGSIPTIGRPGCAVLPLALQAGTPALSFGCIGNRLRTGISDSEIYFAIPGDKWNAVSEALSVVISANDHMARHYESSLLADD